MITNLSITSALVLTWAISGLCADASNNIENGERRLAACKTQNLKCGRQNWCRDDESGEWVKEGDVYDDQNCDPTADAYDKDAGTWRSETLKFDGLKRSYLVYAPTATFAPGNYTGLMLFLHGLGGSSNVHKWYDVAKYSDEYGFIGVVPDGSPWSQEKEEDDSEDKEVNNENSGACEYYLYFDECYEVCGDGDKPIVDREMCDGKVDLAGDKGDGKDRKLQNTFKWNMNDPNGVNEVSFLQHVIEKESEAHSIGAEMPKIAMGFSNGAGMASLLGCYDSFDLWVATAAVFVDENADFPSTCTTVKGAKMDVKSNGGKMLRQLETKRGDIPKTSWSAVGENDFFIDSLQPTPVEGVKNQFIMRHSKSGCPEEKWIETAGEDYTCYNYPNCTSVGELCIYDRIGHAIKPTMTDNAWTYLSSVWVAFKDAAKEDESPTLDNEANSPPTDESSNTASNETSSAPTTSDGSASEPSPSSSGKSVKQSQRYYAIPVLGLLSLLFLMGA